MFITLQVMTPDVDVAAQSRMLFDEDLVLVMNADTAFIDTSRGGANAMVLACEEDDNGDSDYSNCYAHTNNDNANNGELVAANTNAAKNIGLDWYTSTGSNSEITAFNLGALSSAFSDDFATDAGTNKKIVTSFKLGTAADNVVKRYALYAKDYSQYRTEYVDVVNQDWAGVNNGNNAGSTWFEERLGRLYVTTTAPEPLKAYAGMAVTSIIEDTGDVAANGAATVSDIYTLSQISSVWYPQTAGTSSDITRVTIQVPFRTCDWSVAGAFRVFPACGTVAGLVGAGGDLSKSNNLAAYYLDGVPNLDTTAMNGYATLKTVDPHVDNALKFAVGQRLVTIAHADAAGVYSGTTSTATFNAPGAGGSWTDAAGPWFWKDGSDVKVTAAGAASAAFVTSGTLTKDLVVNTIQSTTADHGSGANTAHSVTGLGGGLAGDLETLWAISDGVGGTEKVTITFSDSSTVEFLSSNAGGAWADVYAAAWFETSGSNVVVTAAGAAATVASGSLTQGHIITHHGTTVVTSLDTNADASSLAALWTAADGGSTTTTTVASDVATTNIDSYFTQDANNANVVYVTAAGVSALASIVTGTDLVANERILQINWSELTGGAYFHGTTGLRKLWGSTAAASTDLVLVVGPKEGSTIQSLDVDKAEIAIRKCVESVTVDMYAPRFITFKTAGTTWSDVSSYFTWVNGQVETTGDASSLVFGGWEAGLKVIAHGQSNSVDIIGYTGSGAGRLQAEWTGADDVIWVGDYDTMYSLWFEVDGVDSTVARVHSNSAYLENSPLEGYEGWKVHSIGGTVNVAATYVWKETFFSGLVVQSTIPDSDALANYVGASITSYQSLSDGSATVATFPKLEDACGSGGTAETCNVMVSTLVTGGVDNTAGSGGLQSLWQTGSIPNTLVLTPPDYALTAGDPTLLTCQMPTDVMLPPSSSALWQNTGHVYDSPNVALDNLGDGTLFRQGDVATGDFVSLIFNFDAETSINANSGAYDETTFTSSDGAYQFYFRTVDNHANNWMDPSSAES